MLSINGSGTSDGTKNLAPTTGSGADPRTADRRELKQDGFAQAFASIVAVLMRDANYRSLKIAALEHLVIPAVLAGQWRLAHGPVQIAATGIAPENKASPALVPMAAVLWARVSDAVDKRLIANLDTHMALKPNEWVSGNNLWLIAVVGDRRAAARVLKQLRDGDFKGRTVKILSRGADGKAVVETLDKMSRAGDPPRA